MIKWSKEELVVVTFSQLMLPYSWRKIKNKIGADLGQKIPAETSAN